MTNTSAGALAGRYRLLAGFHGGRRKSAALILSIAFIYTVLVFLSSRDLILTSTGFLVVVLTTLLLNHVVDKTLGRRCQNYTARRLTALSIVEMLIIMTGFALSLLAQLIHPSSAIIIVSSIITSAVFIGFSVRRAIGYRVNPLTVSLISMTPMAVGAIPLYIYLGNFLKAAQTALAAYVVGVVFMETSRYIIDVRKHLQNIKPFTLLQAFLASLLSGNSDELEEMVSGLGRSEEIKCELFVIKRGKQPPLAIVISEIHPGPFRAVGSSTFPSLLQQKLASKGFESVVLKGLSNHEKNIASFKTSTLVAEKIASEAEALTNSSSFSNLFIFPIRQSLGGAKALKFGLAGKTINILTLHPQPMEDLPKEIIPDGLSDNVIVVDAHNSFSDGFEALELEGIEKMKALLQHIKEINAEAVSDVKMGFSRTVPSSIGLAEGLGAGGISCIVFDFSGRRTSIVVADANNSLPWVRDVVVETAMKYGCSDSELCTTDTHMVNAVSVGGRGYHPLGEKIERHILTALFDEIHRKAVETLAPASAAHKSIVVNNVKVFSDFLQTVADSASFGIKTWVRFGFVSVFVSVFVSYFLGG